MNGTPENWKRRHLVLLDQGRLFCHVAHNDQDDFSAWVWFEGGAIDGCHQPRTWVEGFEGNEEWARAAVADAWPGIIFRQVKPFDGETMTVTVIDRQRMDEIYGTPAFAGIVLRQVTIRSACPVCGELRGEPHQQRFHEWGEFYLADTWTNACGHVDKYTDVLRESRAG